MLNSLKNVEGTGAAPDTSMRIFTPTAGSSPTASLEQVRHSSDCLVGFTELGSVQIMRDRPLVR
jgi:hypothetical protein